MRHLIIVTVLWAFSFSLIGEYLAGKVDSDFAVLLRVLIAAAVFLPFTVWPAHCSSASPTCVCTAASAC